MSDSLLRFGSDRDARRSEDGPLLTGRFPDDVSVPGKCHAAFVRQVYDSGEFEAVLDTAGLAEFPARRTASARVGRLPGIGGRAFFTASDRVRRVQA